MMSKKVDFFFRTRLLLDMVSDAGKIDPIEQEVSALAASMHHLQTLQVQLRQQQKEHRKTVYSTNNSVLYWCVFQIVALIAMSLFQIFFLKRFLEKKSSL
uniref:Transmembrane emp24 domain-containing protein A n=1 Tax=Lygus hesperus TaxID=30085 RepID=A0A0A9Z6L6_LYGHE